MHRSRLSLRSLLILGLSVGALTAAGQTTYDWDGSNSTAWATNKNWTAQITNGPGATNIAQFGSVFSGRNQPAVSANASVGELLFISSLAKTVTISGSKTLTIYALGGIGIDNQQSAYSVAINTPVALSVDQTWQISAVSGGSLSFGGTLNLGARTLTLNANNATATITHTGVISASGNLVIGGSGTVNLSGNNTFTGGTTINQGTLKLGSAGSGANTPLGTTATGTAVNSGGALDLNGYTMVTSEALSLSGSGVGFTGAFTNTGAAATYSGAVSLAGDTTIGGTGNVTLTSGLNDLGSARIVTKAGANTLNLNATATSLVDGTAVVIAAGTLMANSASALGNLPNVNISSGATLGLGANQTLGSLTGTGTISIGTYTTAVLNLNSSATDTFDGIISGTGIFDLNHVSSSLVTATSVSGTPGTLTLTNAATNFAGTMLVESGELDFSHSASGASFTTMTVGNGSTTTTLKLNNATINVGTLNITGNTILDFGNSGASILNATNIYIATGVTLTVLNWDSEVDFLYATSNFATIGGTPAATPNATGTGSSFNPEDQVYFPGTNSTTGALTTWTGSNYYYGTYASGGYGVFQNKQIRPVPEPSTYGAIFLGAALALFGYSRYRQQHRPAPATAP